MPGRRNRNGLLPVLMAMIGIVLLLADLTAQGLPLYFNRKSCQRRW